MKHKQTVDYYDKNAQAFFDGTVDVDMSVHYVPFLAYVPDGGSILDVGCGSGRDAKEFIDRGYKVDAFDASSEMADLASEYAGIPVQVATFKEYSADSRYDGIWACASLLHVPENDLASTISKFVHLLTPNGVMSMSFKIGNKRENSDGRLFIGMDENELESILNHSKEVQVIGVTPSSDLRKGRENEKWVTALCRRIY